MHTYLSMMGMLKSSDGWDSMRNVTIDGQRAVRHRVILRPEHKNMRLSSSLGHVETGDIGRELVVDVYEDGSIIDVIADAPARKGASEGKTRLDQILDRVRRGEEEVTIDTDGYTEAQVERILAVAKARGLSASYDGRFVLVRDLGPLEGMSEGGGKLYDVRRVKRVIRGSQRDVTIYTYMGRGGTGYDAFLDLRTELGGSLRRGKNAPTVIIDGRPEYASFEVVEPL